jgi:hypothetical protein
MNLLRLTGSSRRRPARPWRPARRSRAGCGGPGHLRLRGSLPGDLAERRLGGKLPLVSDPPEPGIQRLRVGDHVGHRQAMERGELPVGRLSGRREQHRRPEALGQHPQRRQDRQQQPVRQRLHLIQHQHRAGQPVQLAYGRWPVVKQRLEQLHGRGDHERCVPVLRRQPAPPGPAVPAFVEISPTVVFQHHRVFAWAVQQPPVYLGVLLGDRDERHRHHHVAEPVDPRMVQGKSPSGQGLARPGRCWQPVHPTRPGGRRHRLRVDLLAPAVRRR